MSSADQPDEIVDDVDHHRFVYEHGGALAEVVYQRGRGRLTILHTEVPHELSGRGIAGRLVRTAVEQAANQGLTVVPECPYARKWLQDHPDVAHGVTIDWVEPC